jgi:hypothetical protein
VNEIAVPANDRCIKGQLSVLIPARANSATLIAMRMPPRLLGMPATVAAITSASAWV